MCCRPTALVGCALAAAAVASATLLVCRTSTQYRELWGPAPSAKMAGGTTVLAKDYRAADYRAYKAGAKDYRAYGASAYRGRTS